VVYRAKQLTTDQEVAVKILRTDRLANLKTADVEIARFQREMKLIGRVNHPHIVRLIDSGQIPRQSNQTGQPSPDDTVVGLPPEEAAARERNLARDVASSIPYLVMELLSGETLASYRRRRHRLPLKEAVDIIVPVAAAVAEAHEAGVIHRDLKPSNIVLSPTQKDGCLHPHVLDFGIAKLVEEGVDDLTRTASVIGTPDYMSPEQARGKRDISGAADQYTLAVVLYECVTGHKPYDADSFVELVHLVSAGNFDRPSKHREDVDVRLEEVIVRAMSLTPQERFPSMTAFGRALLSFASDEAQQRYASLFR
jgi:serine/threonine protein kinase